MKAKLFFNLFLLITIIAQHINAQSFVNRANRWHIQNTCTGSEPFGGSEVFAYFLKDSILINGRVYLKMYKTLDTTLQTATLIGFFYREEDSKVYLFRQGFSERLIYDFNLRIGDTLTIGDESFDIQIKVVSTDSVTLNDGSKRKRLVIKNNRSTPEDNRTVTWIEGIGSEVAPLDTRVMFVSDCGSNLHCFYQENELLYQARDFFGFPLSCTLYGDPVSVDDLPELNGLKVFPNPFATELFLDAALLGDFQLKTDYAVTVFDNQGRQMYQSKVSWVDNIRINTSHWSSGLYFLVIRSANGMLSRKLVKI
mgnify:CR=1 FL=1